MPLLQGPHGSDRAVSRSGKHLTQHFSQTLGLKELVASPLTCSHYDILGSWRPVFTENNC